MTLSTPRSSSSRLPPRPQSALGGGFRVGGSGPSAARGDLAIRDAEAKTSGRSKHKSEEDVHKFKPSIGGAEYIDGLRKQIQWLETEVKILREKKVQESEEGYTNDPAIKRLRAKQQDLEKQIQMEKMRYGELIKERERGKEKENETVKALESRNSNLLLQLEAGINVDKMQQLLKHLDEELENIQKLEKRAKDARSEAGRKIKQQKGDIKDLEAFEAAETEEAPLKKARLNLQSQISLVKELMDASRKLTNSMKNLASVESKLYSNALIAQKLEAEKAALTEECRQLEDELDPIEGRNKDLERAIRQAKNEIKSRKLQLEDAEEELQTVQVEYFDMEHEILKNLQGGLGGLNLDEENALKEQLTSLIKQKKDAQLETERMEAANNYLQKQREQIIQEHHNQEQQIEEYKQQLHNLREEHEDRAYSGSFGMKLRIPKLEQQIKRLEGKLAEARGETAQAQSQLNDTTKELKRQSEQADEAKRSIEEAKKMLRIDELQESNGTKRELHLKLSRESAMRQHLDVLRDRRLDQVRATQGELGSRMEQLELGVLWSKQVAFLKQIHSGAVQPGSLIDSNLLMLKVLKDMKVTQELQAAYRAEASARECLNHREWETARKMLQDASEHYVAAHKHVDDSVSGEKAKAEKLERRSAQALEANQMCQHQMDAEACLEAARNMKNQGRIREAQAELDRATACINVLLEFLNTKSPIGGEPVLDLGASVRRWKTELIEMLQLTQDEMKQIAALESASLNTE